MAVDGGIELTHSVRTKSLTLRDEIWEFQLLYVAARRLPRRALTWLSPHGERPGGGRRHLAVRIDTEQRKGKPDSEPAGRQEQKTPASPRRSLPSA